jgi:hypothetical protein
VHKNGCFEEIKELTMKQLTFKLSAILLLLFAADGWAKQD